MCVCNKVSALPVLMKMQLMGDDDADDQCDAYMPIGNKVYRLFFYCYYYCVFYNLVSHFHSAAHFLFLKIKYLKIKTLY